MKFRKYQHLERLGTTEVQGIEYGECYVFPKIDGTNGSIWIDEGVIKAGSRRRDLSEGDDNAGFYEWVKGQLMFSDFFSLHPHLRLYGEWLVPHSLKTYKPTAWQNFYVFDVCTDGSGEDELRYLHYEDYKPLLEQFGISYIHPLAVITNGSYEQFINQLAHNVFLIEDGMGTGEGIVLKNYGWSNKYGRQTWAKIVTSEFKEKHAKEMGAPNVKGKDLLEEAIAKKHVTGALVDKEYSKIEVAEGWNSRQIPRLLNTVFYSVVKEDCWEFVKENKNPVIDFKRLQHFVFNEVKQHKPELF